MIEETLVRIAVALEKQNELVCMLAFKKAGPESGPFNQGADVPVETVKKTRKVAEPVKPVVAEPVAEEIDPFAAEPEPVAASKEVTFDMLSDFLRKHSVTFGTKTTMALMIKHGADKGTPKLNTIPEKSFNACYAEAQQDFDKLKKG